MDPTYLLFSLIFGTIGLIGLRHGKSEGNMICALLGLGLLVYPYFLGGWLWLFGMGIFLTAGIWYFWETN